MGSAAGTAGPPPSRIVPPPAASSVVGACTAALPSDGVSMSITEAACRASAEATGAGSQPSVSTLAAPPGASSADSCSGVGRRAGSLARQAAIAGASVPDRPPSSASSCTTLYSCAATPDTLSNGPCPVAA